ncbi:uncharacterized protein LTR77_004221 [Saxophila tyrrhenica]|uniref:Uncharacterized protein n=1 Tax=Saxophila tyrrhenica TaxID=1690608 RepID=A0AAV9PC65_9PEZI|nr:hypothetical protein LTR77_004221 [Saxophila tyrrhenica]
MAFIAARRAYRWPPHLAPPALQHQIPRRTFTAPSRSRGPITDFAVAGPNAIIESLHNTGLPYYAVIPLTAVLLRSTFVYHFSGKPARRKAQIGSNLIPLIQARSKMLSDSPREVRKIRGSSENPGFLGAVYVNLWRRMQISWLTYLSRRKYLKMFASSVPWWAINFGVLITFAETIRLKCGKQEGLLSMLLTPLENLRNMLMRELAPAEPAAGERPVRYLEQQAREMWAYLESKRTPVQDGEIIDLSSSPASADAGLQAGADIDTTSPYFDAAMQTEGFSFCTDLTAADPSGVLPVLTGVVMLIQVFFRPDVNARPVVPPKPTSAEPDLITSESRSVLRQLSEKPMRYAKQTPWLRQFGFYAALLFCYVSFHLPAAVLLYVIPNVAVGWLQGRYLDIKRPLRPAIQKCKRPLRYRARTEINL